MKPRATCMLGKQYTSNHIQERWDNVSKTNTAHADTHAKNM